MRVETGEEKRQIGKKKIETEKSERKRKRSK